MICLISTIDGSVWFSGFIGGVIGGAMCGLVTGLYIQWDRRELARHNLRSIVITMLVHVKQGKGPGGVASEPWSKYMDEAISCYHRYLAIVPCWKRDSLVSAWKTFQGVDPEGDSAFAFKPMVTSDEAMKRVRAFIDVLR